MMYWYYLKIITSEDTYFEQTLGRRDQPFHWVGGEGTHPVCEKYGVELGNYFFGRIYRVKILYTRHSFTIANISPPLPDCQMNALISI